MIIGVNKKTVGRLKIIFILYIMGAGSGVKFSSENKSLTISLNKNFDVYTQDLEIDEFDMIGYESGLGSIKGSLIKFDSTLFLSTLKERLKEKIDEMKEDEYKNDELEFEGVEINGYFNLNEMYSAGYLRSHLYKGYSLNCEIEEIDFQICLSYLKDGKRIEFYEDLYFDGIEESVEIYGEVTEELENCYETLFFMYFDKNDVKQEVQSLLSYRLENEMLEFKEYILQLDDLTVDFTKEEEDDFVEWILNEKKDIVDDIYIELEDGKYNDLVSDYCV